MLYIFVENNHGIAPELEYSDEALKRLPSIAKPHS